MASDGQSGGFGNCGQGWCGFSYPLEALGHLQLPLAGAHTHDVLNTKALRPERWTRIVRPTGPRVDEQGERTDLLRARDAARDSIVISFDLMERSHRLLQAYNDLLVQARNWPLPRLDSTA